MLVLDHDRAGGYWGRSVFTAVKGLRVIIDGPVGCENLPVTSVLRYPTVYLRELRPRRHRHRGGGARSRAPGRDAPRPQDARPGPAERRRDRIIAEMIGGGSPRGDRDQRFLPHVDEDQWQSANRAMLWLWTQYGMKNGRAPRPRPSADGDRPRVNIIGPSYGYFNTWSISRRIRRLIEGIGAEVNLTFPRDPPRGCPRLADADVNVVMYREYGRLAARGARQTIPASAHRSSQHDALPAVAREHLHLDPEPFIEREKHTTLKPLWDLWRSVTQDFFGTATVRDRRQRDVRPGARPSSRASSELPCNFAFERKPGAKTDNEAIRAAVQTKTPLVVFRVPQRADVPRRIGSRRSISRRRSRARRSGGTPAPPTWATPAPPILLQRGLQRPSSTRSSTCCRSARTSTRSTRRRPRLTRSSPGTRPPNRRCRASSTRSPCSPADLRCKAAPRCGRPIAARQAANVTSPLLHGWRSRRGSSLDSLRCSSNVPGSPPVLRSRPRTAT